MFGISRTAAWLVAVLVFHVALVEVVWAQESGRYRIGPRDRLQVRVDELPTLDSEQEVADDGTITLEVIGSLQAQGLSEVELADRIRGRLLEEGLRKATVRISVSEYRSRPVAIMGAVGEPGNHSVPGRSTLLEVLLGAGGLSADHGTHVQVRRRADNGLSDQVTIAIRDLVELGDPTVNIPIYAGDLINVPPARDVVINILGAVASVGSHTFKGTQRVTLLTAIARAGGLAEEASNKIRIKRQGENGEWSETVIDWKRLLAGKIPDPPLEDGDLIVVKESFF
ncbi:MAG: polysaccharide biosynthesis/export family protein [Acidobacteriota bacterium]